VLRRRANCPGLARASRSSPFRFPGLAALRNRDCCLDGFFFAGSVGGALATCRLQGVCPLPERSRRHRLSQGDSNEVLAAQRFARPVAHVSMPPTAGELQLGPGVAPASEWVVR